MRLSSNGAIGVLYSTNIRNGTAYIGKVTSNFMSTQALEELDYQYASVSNLKLPS